MHYQPTPEFARELDEQDGLNHFRNQFLIPRHNGRDIIYLCGNSLGLQPASAQKYIAEKLSAWQHKAVEGWFDGEEPWLGYHREVAALAAPIVGAKTTEVTIMNSLTVNLHLLLVSFYKPINKKYKILVEADAFPSDHYAVESQVRFHGYDPADAIIQLYPREGEHILRSEDVLQKIQQHKDQLALVMFGGINYYTGQYHNLQIITKAAHDAGAYAGFDLAHAAGNVPLKLHDWGVDFACWCSYKYLNAGPGGISGIFIHERHHANATLNRFAGWWGYPENKRFLMAPGFKAATGAEGWQVSTSPIPLLALLKASLDIFTVAGGMGPLRQKSVLLTGYFEFLINNINNKHSKALLSIITPADVEARGSQLSIVCALNGKKIFNFLSENGVIGDWREPDVIRLAPVPLYNTFTDVFNACNYLDKAYKNLYIN